MRLLHRTSLLSNVVIGVGGCGINNLKEFIESSVYDQALSTMFSSFRHYIVIDIHEIRLKKRVEKIRYGLDFSINKYQLGLRSVEVGKLTGGAGGNWFASMDATKEEIKGIRSRIDDSLEHLRGILYMVHSAGGGTGCGVSPFLSSKLNKLVLEKGGIILPIMIFPHETKKDDVMTNALSCTMRYRNSGIRGVIVAENSEFNGRLLRVNENISKVMKRISLSAFLGEGLTYPKTFEIEDITNAIGTRPPKLMEIGFPALIVPCFKSWSINSLNYLKLSALTILTLLRYPLARYNIDPQPKGVLIFIALPTKLFNKFTNMNIVSEVEDYIREKIFCKKDLRVETYLINVPEYRTNIDILGLVIDPSLPIIKKFNNLISAYEDNRKDFISNVYGHFKPWRRGMGHKEKIEYMMEVFEEGVYKNFKEYYGLKYKDVNLKNKDIAHRKKELENILEPKYPINMIEVRLIIENGEKKNLSVFLGNPSKVRVHDISRYLELLGYNIRCKGRRKNIEKIALKEINRMYQLVEYYYSRYPFTGAREYIKNKIYELCGLGYSTEGAIYELYKNIVKLSLPSYPLVEIKCRIIKEERRERKMRGKEAKRRKKGKK